MNHLHISAPAATTTTTHFHRTAAPTPTRCGPHHADESHLKYFNTPRDNDIHAICRITKVVHWQHHHTITRSHDTH